MLFRSAPARHAAALAAFSILALAWTWPLPTHLASRVAFDPGDPLLNAWIIWWNAQAVPFTQAWWSPPIFFPMEGALALSEHLAGLSLFTTPILLAGGTPALAYNAALLLSCALSGFFAYLLVHRLTGSTPAALCAGAAYALAPFRAGQLSHLQVLTSQWLPLMLLGLHGYVDSGRRRWLAVFAGAWTVQSLSNGYYMLYAPVLAAAWVAWFVVYRRCWRQAAEIGAAWVAGSLPLLPVALEYREVHTALGLSRRGEEILRFSGTLESFLKPAPMLAHWPAWLDARAEDYLFPGLTMILVLAGAAVHSGWSRHGHRLRAGTPRPPVESQKGTRPMAAAVSFYLVATVFMAALTLGPAAPGDGVLGLVKPYEWLMRLPGFDGLRVPVRFAMFMALCLSIAGGLCLAAVMPARPRLRALLTAAVCAGLWVDGAIEPLLGSPPPGRAELPQVSAGAVLELPPDDARVSVGAMFRSISHGLPLINGYSGHVPRHYDILGRSLRRQDPSALLELARGRTLLLLISQRYDRGGDFRRLVEGLPGVQRGVMTGGGVAYVLPAQPSRPAPRGETVHEFVATRHEREHAVLDLGAPRAVRLLEFPLRTRYRNLGRRIAIETSDDAVTWTLADLAWTGGAALSGALEDQVNVPVRLYLRDVRVRYLRLHPAPDWLVDELRVIGP